MTGVTILDLKDYRHLQKEIRTIDEELEWTYYPVASPNGKTSGSRGSEPSDPTARAVRKAARLKERRARLQAKVEAIDWWLLNLEDHQLAAICRARYVLGRPWSEISMEICGSGSEATSRSIVRRYFGSS